MSERVLAIVRNRLFGDKTLKHVLELLASAAQDNDSRINVSVGTLAEDCEVTEKTIQRTLRQAKKLGILRLMCRELGPLPRIYSLDVPHLATYPLTDVGQQREEHLGAGP